MQKITFKHDCGGQGTDRYACGSTSGLTASQVEEISQYFTILGCARSPKQRLLMVVLPDQHSESWPSLAPSTLEVPLTQFSGLGR